MEVFNSKKTEYFVLPSFSDNVHDMTTKLYPTSTEAEVSKWTKHVKHSFDVVSENECAAHAALCQDGIIEFYVYAEPKCNLGDLSHTSGNMHTYVLNSKHKI